MLNFALSKQQSLLSELWEYFIDKYFSVEVPYLENFKLGSGSLVSLRWIIIGIVIGIVVASACSIYNKRYVGDFVRKVISEECFDASSAKTLYELGYLKHPAIRGMLKSGGTLSRWIRCVEEDDFIAATEAARQAFEEEHKNHSKPPKFKEPVFERDCNTMHFYIPEDKKYAADVKFDAKGADWRSFVAVTIISVVLCMFICYILPDMIKLVDNFISVMK